jgi:predicted RNase H-like HicB family nuclease
MHKYAVFIYWSDEDEAYIAEVPELPGCITHGSTRSAALANADEAVQLWLDTAKEFKKTIPIPSGRSVINTAEAHRLRTKPQQSSSLSLRRKNRPAHQYDITKLQPVTNPRSR